jgi:hypothetical protein
VAQPGWERRNARARDLGYRNWYDYRIHDYGRLPPAAPRLQGEQAATARGHRGEAHLHRAIAGRRIELISVFPVGPRNSEGQWQEVELVTVDSQGNQRTYILKGEHLDPVYLGQLKAAIDTAGIGYIASPSLDIFAGIEAPEQSEELAA